MSRVAAFLVGCAVFGPGLHAAKSASPWTVNTSDDGTVVASLTLDHVSQRNSNMLAVFNVGFGTKTMCRGEIGTALLSGGGYGRPIGSDDPSKTDVMVVRVDANSEWQVHPFLVKYENGWEALFNATDALLAQLQSGSFAYSRITRHFDPPDRDPVYGVQYSTSIGNMACIPHCTP
jgi:hypothetical protein